MDQDSAYMVAASKVPMLKPGEYELWRMRMEQYIQMIDYSLWEVIENGNAPPMTKVVEGVETTIAPTTVEEKAQRRLELKARSTLLTAVEKRFRGNAATKKTQRNLLKQQYENFTPSSSEVLDQTFDRLQKLISQLEVHGESISQEDVNQKFLKSLSPEWNTRIIVWRNKPEIDTLSLDDLYNNMKIYEPEVKGTSSSNINTQNIAFVSSNSTINTNEAVNTAHDATTATTQAAAVNSTIINNVSDAVICSFFASQPNNPQVNNEDLQQIHPDDLEEMDLRAQRNQENKNRKSSRRSVPVETLASSALVSCDGLGGYDWSDQAKEGIFMPPKPDLSFSSLEEFVNEPIVSEPTVKKPVVETSEAKVSADKPKVVRKNFGSRLIEDWISDSEDKVESKPKIEKKTVKTSFAKIKFVESKKQVKSPRKTTVKQGSRPDWLFDIDALTRTMNYELIIAGTQSNNFAGSKANDNAGQARMEKAPIKDYILLTLWTADLPFSQQSKSSQDDGFQPSIDHGKKVDEDQRQKSECKDQEKEDNVNNTNNVNAAGTNGVNLVGANINNELPFDPEMPALEDISTFNFLSNHEDDDEMVDMNNLDTTIQVSPDTTTRIHKDHPLDQVIGDLHSTTQTRHMSKNLEEHGLLPLFIKEQTINTFKTICLLALSQKNPKRNKTRLVAQGHIQEEGIDYDEVFAPVARIEAIRLFLAYASFKDFVVYQMDVKSAFLYGKIEEEVFVCQPPGFEDPDFTDKVYKVKKALYGLHQDPRACYETLSTYLLDNGFHKGKINKTLFIKRHKGDILQVQVYVDDIIFEGKNARTPMKTQKPLLKDEDGEEVDVHMYRLIIGSLMYLTSSRPDIMFTVCACVRYQVNPKVSHLHVVKRIFRYLKGQPKFGLWYPKDSHFDLVAYIDSDYAGESLDRKSTTGGCQLFGCRLISWQCKKQTAVANSTTKAEYTKRKDTELPQTSGPRINIADETVNEEMDDSLERAATTASSLEVEQDSGVNIPRKYKDHTSTGDCSLKRRVKKLEKKQRSRTLKLKRLYKVGLTASVDSSDEVSLGEDASKLGRIIDDIDADEGITLVNETVENQGRFDDKEFAKLKQCLEIIPEDGDDVTIDATPLSSNKMLKIFDREDLEVLWRLVKARFEKIKPVDYMDNLLLHNLKAMFEHHVEDNSIPFYLLVEKMYPLTNHTLHQMFNNVKLQADYECEMTFNLLRLVKKQVKEGYVSK
nr:ribonuclease H-like domain-containing protein [Tanacetum cinerariifolium]